MRASRLALLMPPFVLADANTISICYPLEADVTIILFHLTEKWFHGMFYFSFTSHYQSFISKNTPKKLFMQALFSGFQQSVYCSSCNTVDDGFLPESLTWLSFQNCEDYKWYSIGGPVIFFLKCDHSRSKMFL